MNYLKDLFIDECKGAIVGGSGATPDWNASEGEVGSS